MAQLGFLAPGPPQSDNQVVSQSTAVSRPDSLGLFFAIQWTEGPNSSPVVPWRPPLGPWLTGLPIEQLTTWQLASSEQASQDERETETER